MKGFWILDFGLSILVSGSIVSVRVISCYASNLTVCFSLASCGMGILPVLVFDLDA